MSNVYESVETALADKENIDWNVDEKKADAITLAFAANEIRQNLISIGEEVSFFNPNFTQKHSSIVLQIVKNGSSLPEHLDYSIDDALSLENQGFTLKFDGTNVYILAQNRIGVLYGAYAFLNKLGFSWDDPYETNKPSPERLRDPIVWANDTWIPKISLRGFWIYEPANIPDEFLIWLARNRLNLAGVGNPTLSKMLGIKSWAGGHDLLQEEFSRDGLFESHPEWFALIENVHKKIDRNGTYYNPAFYNNAAAIYFADQLVKRLMSGDLKNVDILNVWPADAKYNLFDRSMLAKKIGNDTDNLLFFSLAVTREIDRAHLTGKLNRRVTIAGISYFSTMEPPTNLTTVDELKKLNYIQIIYPIERSWSNLYNVDNRTSSRNFKITNEINKWKSLVGLKIGFVEYHNVSFLAGICLSDFENFAKNFEILTDGKSELYSYMHPLLHNPGPRRLTNELMAKLSWSHVEGADSSLSTDDKSNKIISNYFNRRFESQAGNWKKINEMMSQSVDNSSEIFGENSLFWIIMQDQMWADAPFTKDEAAEYIQRYRDGGAQTLPGKFYNEQDIEVSFRGLDESIKLQVAAELLWNEALNATHDIEVRRHMLSDIAWFTATNSRYRLMRLSSDFFRLKLKSGNTEYLKLEISKEIDLLSNSPVTKDTLSPVDQRIFLNYHRKLIAP